MAETEVVLEQPAGVEKPAATEKPAGDKPAEGSTQRPAAGEKPAGEDPRIKGMLADLQKERTARQAVEARIKTQEQELERERKRVAIALGINPVSPEDQEVEQVKAAFARMFPHLAELTPESIKELQDAASQGKALQSTTEKYWVNHGRQMLTKVQASIADELGGGDLTPRQRQQIIRAYTAEAEANPEFLQRHEDGDDTLVAEFVKNFIEDWGGPIRRAVTTTEVNRQRPLPNGRGRNVQSATPKKIDFTNQKAVEDAFVESYKANGGTFPG